jgi:ABC-type glycerol-3-phosphate transport system substrate-binding protein
MKLIASGRAATALGGRWWLCTLRNDPGLRLGAIEAPRGPEQRFYGYGRSTLINRNSPHRQEALRFLLYMAGQPYNRLINQEADGLGPMIRFATPDNLLDPAHAGEDFHAVFPVVMARSLPEEISPYVNAAVADRIITKQIDLVCRGTKSPADAMKSAVEQINREIEKNLRRTPNGPEAS